MEERQRFVAKLVDGEAMSDVSREFGISRKTRLQDLQSLQGAGFEALSDRSRRPVCYANQRATYCGNRPKVGKRN